VEHFQRSTHCQGYFGSGLQGVVGICGKINGNEYFFHDALLLLWFASQKCGHRAFALMICVNWPNDAGPMSKGLKKNAPRRLFGAARRVLGWQLLPMDGNQ
jgi:hypothetical protein